MSMSPKLTKDDVLKMIEDIKTAKEEEGAEVPVFKEVPPPEVPKPKIEERKVVDKRSALERIADLIQQGQRVSANYYAARGTHIIEIVFPYEYEEDILNIVYHCKIDPEAPDVMMQAPSFAQMHPEDARGIGAFQLFVNNPKQLITSGYDVIKMLGLLKEKPVIITASTSINEKPLINALK